MSTPTFSASSPPSAAVVAMPMAYPMMSPAQVLAPKVSTSNAPLGDLLFSSGTNKPQALAAGQAYKVKLVAGLHYQVLRESAKNVEPLAEGVVAAGDNVIALRQGEDLLLRYADGTSLSLEDFYTVCTNEVQCTLTLPGENAEGYTFSADAAQAADSESMLVYAWGEQDLLRSMAQGQTARTDAIIAFGDAPSGTFTPPLSRLQAKTGSGLPEHSPSGWVA